jgi:hypothetical protein
MKREYLIALGALLALSVCHPCYLIRLTHVNNRINKALLDPALSLW